MALVLVAGTAAWRLAAIAAIDSGHCRDNGYRLCRVLLVRCGVISSLQVEDKAEGQLDPADGSVAVGMKIDFHAKENQVF